MDLDEIVDTFEALEPGEERYRYLIDLGKDLEGLPDALKTEDRRVHGCQSRVWMDVRPADDDPARLHVRADSDAFVVRGLVAIVLAMFDRRTPAEILDTDPIPTFTKLGLEQMLSMGRRNGLHSMVVKLKELAAAA